MRKNEAALRRGTFEFILTNDEKNTLAYRRDYGQESIIVALNNSKHKQTVTLNAGGKQWRELLSGEEHSSTSSNLEIGIAPRSGVVLKRSK